MKSAHATVLASLSPHANIAVAAKPAANITAWSSSSSNSNSNSNSSSSTNSSSSSSSSSSSTGGWRRRGGLPAAGQTGHYPARSLCSLQMLWSGWTHRNCKSPGTVRYLWPRSSPWACRFCWWPHRQILESFRTAAAALVPGFVFPAATFASWSRCGCWPIAWQTDTQSAIKIARVRLAAAALQVRLSDNTGHKSACGANHVGWWFLAWPTEPQSVVKFGKGSEGRAGQSRTGQGRAGLGGAKQGRAGRGRTGQGRAGQGKAVTWQGKAGQGRAERGRVGHGKAGQGRAVTWQWLTWDASDDVCMILSLYWAQADDRQSWNDKGCQVCFLYRQPIMTLDHNSFSGHCCCGNRLLLHNMLWLHLIGSTSYISYDFLPLIMRTSKHNTS